MTWARSGCLVLVMDHLGHGERQHPFRTEADYPHLPGRRQDYYFRHNTGTASLVGESLMGWMAWDLMRGLDLLLSRPASTRTASSSWVRSPGAATRRP